MINFQKHLLLIHDLAMKFPNSGSLMTALKDYDKKLKKIKEKQNEIRKYVYQLIGIITDIAYHNPKAYSWSAGILSELIHYIGSKTKQEEIIEKIQKKFKKIPNTGYLDIWLQRVVLSFNYNIDFDEPICKLVNNVNTLKKEGKDISIWNSDWLKPSLQKIISPKLIVDHKELKRVKGLIIQHEEISIFDY